jgi:phosphatidylserine/phosphatidylglycerophosphate/cardiolipin synthase-like enzyme
MKRAGAGAMMALVALAVAGCLAPPAAMPGGTVLPLTTDHTATPGPTAAASLDESWYSLYFTSPAANASVAYPTGGIPDKIAASFDAAQKSIDLAIYQLDLAPIADALVRARQRGVQVRVVTDSDSLSMDGIKTITQAGIPVVPDKRSAIMHDKFAVVDGALVWSGSMNFTVSDAYHNDNNVIEIRSPELAQNYTHEFEKMFVSQKFGGHTQTDATPNPVLTIGGDEVDNYFSPKGNVAEHINDALGGARKAIYFMAFSFTRKDFGRTLLDKAAAGLDVRGVFESEQLYSGGTEVWNMLSQGGMAQDVRQDGNSKNMHNKVFVVDQAIVITGSYNFSASAEDSNDENALIIHDPAMAAAYYAQWERIWAQGK